MTGSAGARRARAPRIRIGIGAGVALASALAVGFAVLRAAAAAPQVEPPRVEPPQVEPPGPARFVVSVDVRPRSSVVLEQLGGAEPIASVPGIDAVAVVELPDLPSAAAWALAAAFATRLRHEPDVLALGDAPIAGGGLALPGDARVHGIVVTRIDDAGIGSPAWSRSATSLLEDVAGARPTDLMVDVAPLFAAPAAVLPPAAERHALVPRTAEVWTLGHVDRCTGQGPSRRCLHWAQVVARTGDRFVFGYLPAMWLAAKEGWVPGPDRRPRAQLVRSGRAGERARLLLLARDADGVLHRRPVEISAPGDRWPAAMLSVSGGIATITTPNAPAITLALNASLDARPDDL